jgi:hypothetical protein
LGTAVDLVVGDEALVLALGDQALHLGPILERLALAGGLGCGFLGFFLEVGVHLRFALGFPLGLRLELDVVEVIVVIALIFITRRCTRSTRWLRRLGRCLLRSGLGGSLALGGFLGRRRDAGRPRRRALRRRTNRRPLRGRCRRRLRRGLPLDRLRLRIASDAIL